MDKDQTTSIVEEGLSTEQSVMSADDFISQRLKTLTGEDTQVEDPEPVEEDTTEESDTEETAEPEEGEAQTEEEEDAEDDVLSQIPDLESLSPEQRDYLAKELSSRAVSRFGELTARAKAAEEKLAEIQNDPDKLFKQKRELADNPLAKLSTMEELQKEAERTQEVIKWARDVLFQSDDYSHDDVVTQVGETEYTKADVRQALLNAERTKDELIPDQYQRIQKREYAGRLREAYDQKTAEQLDWLNDSEHELTKHYNGLLEDPRVKDAMSKIDPEFAAQLPWIMAHAADSIYRTEQAKKKPKVNPKDLQGRKRPVQARTGNAGHASTKSSSGLKKAIADAQGRYDKSGSLEDLARLRALTY